MSIQAFLRACQEGNEAEVTRLLERDPALVNRWVHLCATERVHGP